MLGKFVQFIAALSLIAVTGIANAEIVNINKADTAALEQNLEGIGPVKAKAIVDYRRKNGSFKSIEDLAKVDGVGEMLIKNNRKNISLSKGATTASKPKPGSAKKSTTSSSKKTTAKAKESSDKTGKSKAKKTVSKPKKEASSKKSTTKTAAKKKKK